MSSPADRPRRPLTLAEARAVRSHARRLCDESRALITASAALIANARKPGGLDSELVSAIATKRRELRAIVLEAAMLARQSDLPREDVLGVPALADAPVSGDIEALAVVCREAIGWYEEAYAY